MRGQLTLLPGSYPGVDFDYEARGFYQERLRAKLKRRSPWLKALQR